MADEQSYIFDFTRVDDFIEMSNIAFFYDEMFIVTGVDSTTKEYIYEDDTVDDNFELLLVEYAPNNIADYLDEYGCLKDEITVNLIEDCALDYYNQGNANATIELHDEVEFEIGEEDVQLKAILLRNKSTGYIMGYSINMVSVPVTNRVVFDDDIIFWDITRYNSNG